MCRRTFQLERLWLRVRSIPGEPFPGGGRRVLETLGFEGKYPVTMSGFSCLRAIKSPVSPYSPSDKNVMCNILVRGLNRCAVGGGAAVASA